MAQLTPEQKLVDFQQLAALFSKRYAFYEWKQRAISYDSLDLAPWAARIRASKDDLEFFEICAEYVARNQDGHTTFQLPSDFAATLPFSVDIFDGVIRVDHINRAQLSARAYPFDIGDELASIDGVPAADAARNLSRLVGDGNSRTVQRLGAMFLTVRPQYLVPRAHEVGDSAVAVFRRPSGELLTLSIPWTKQGTPYVMAGPSPNPRGTAAMALAADLPGSPPYLQRLRSLQQFRVATPRFVTGVDALTPVFGLPPLWTQRLGSGKYDSIFTGTFETSGLKIGFMRLPDFEYISSTDMRNEITYFQANTDGLVIDVMRNPGGYGCTAEGVLSYLMPGGYHSVGNKVRVTWDMLLGFQSDVDWAEAYGESEEVIAILEKFLEQAKRAYAENRGFTTPLPICGMSLDIEPARDRQGVEITYSKPIMLLTDELSASAAEMFAAVLQDEKRALLYGMRTDGAGGAVYGFNVGAYMEAQASMAQSILIRKNLIDTGGEYPTADYVENIGVRPDKSDDYMTLENLLQSGRPFVNRFVTAMVEYIQSKK